VRWECAESPFCGDFQGLCESEGNGFLFSSLSIRPAFPPQRGIVVNEPFTSLNLDKLSDHGIDLIGYLEWGEVA
jgi:hypothetical protein